MTAIAPYVVLFFLLIRSSQHNPLSSQGVTSSSPHITFWSRVILGKGGFNIPNIQQTNLRGVTLEGADQGIKYYLTPQWDKLFERKVSSPFIAFMNHSFAPLRFFRSFPVVLIDNEDEVVLKRDI